MTRSKPSELGSFFATKFPTCIQGPINHPFHQGQPNPAHGKFYFAGSIPGSCYDHETKSSKKYPCESDAIAAALAAGVTHLQGADCRKIVWPV